MSAKHPVIAVTGSSGAGTTTTSLAFRKIFAQLNLHAAEVEGDSFHRYTRPEMDMAIRKARDAGRHISYFGPEANDFGLLEQTFIEYGQSGKGKSRKYLHTYDEAVPWNQVPGTFTPWQSLPEPTDVLFYEGLHGGVVTPQHNVAQHVDLLVDAPRDKCTLSCAINGIHAAFHYLKKNYISGCVMTVPTG